MATLTSATASAERADGAAPNAYWFDRGAVLSRRLFIAAEIVAVRSSWCTRDTGGSTTTTGGS
jgi:hypothetical protein